MSDDDAERPQTAAPDETITPSDGESDADAPLSELADRVAERRRQKDPSAGGRDGKEPAPPGVDADPDEDPFEEMSVSEIDEETLWASLADDADEGSELSVGAGRVDGDATARTAEGAETEPTEHVVSKEAYCQKCPHLSDPPELACTHEGTEIVEVVDSEHFRVRACPMVEE